MTRHRAFALTELLIVIVMIAFLLALSLPAIERTRNAAKLVQCTMNMRMIGQAMLNYAKDNSGSLPEHANSIDPWVVEPGGLWKIADFSFFFQEGNTINADPPDAYANLGQLMNGGYLGHWDISPSVANKNVADPSFARFRFCPGEDPGTIAGVAKQFHSSYYLNPHWSYSTYGEAPGRPPTYRVTWFRKLSDYPPQLALACEMMCGRNAKTPVPHPGPGKSCYWNLLFSDGHVASVLDNTVAQMGASSGFSMNTLPTFDDCLDILETEAENGDIQKMMALPGYSARNMKPGRGSGPLVFREYNYPNTAKYGAITYTGPVNWP